MRKNLKQARSDAGITQADIAKKLGVTYQMVYQWEKGLAPVARKHWNTLASLLHVDEEGLEDILVQTLFDACVAANDGMPLRKAHDSRLYRPELIMKVAEKLQEIADKNNPDKQEETESRAIFDRERLDFERKILERDRRIFELEKQVDELKRELEQARRPAASLSSVLNIEQTETEVKT